MSSWQKPQPEVSYPPMLGTSTAAVVVDPCEVAAAQGMVSDERIPQGAVMKSMSIMCCDSD